ncbi:MAG: hypothetical protein Q9225_005618 [Loekoesia sp. 1 TL-2023]
MISPVDETLGSTQKFINAADLLNIFVDLAGLLPNQSESPGNPGLPHEIIIQGFANGPINPLDSLFPRYDGASVLKSVFLALLEVHRQKLRVVKSPLANSIMGILERQHKKGVRLSKPERYYKKIGQIPSDSSWIFCSFPDPNQVML